MGRDKARLRLGRKTLLGHVRGNAEALGTRVRVLRRDLVLRCGPLGGIYSALKTTQCAAVLFLACDMPFVTTDVLRSLVAKFDGRRAVFASSRGVPGFPLMLSAAALPVVERVMASPKRSVRNLAGALEGRLARVPARVAFNINTRDDLILARNSRFSAQDQLVKRR